MEGRLRYLRDRTEYSVVTLHVTERRAFAPARKPGLGTEVARVWSYSVGLVGELGRGALLLIVALAPWLLLTARLGVPTWRLARRLARG